MIGRQRRQFAMFLKVRDFFAHYGSSFPAGSIGATLFAALLALIEQIEQVNAEKASAVGEVGQSIEIKGNAKDHLEDILENIAGMAVTMSYEIVGIDSRFKMPNNRSAQNLITAGRAFASNAVEYQADFKRYEFPDDFIQHLTEATDALEAAYAETGEDTQNRIGKVAALVPLFKDGMTLVRRLDPIVKMKFRNDAAALAAWTFAKHVERAPQSPRPASQPTA